MGRPLRQSPPPIIENLRGNCPSRKIGAPEKERHAMKKVPFTLEQLNAPKKAAPAKQAGRRAAKTTVAKPGRESARLMRRLRDFTWDFDAMKRA